MRIEGVAYIPEPEEYPETWEVTDQPVPLRVEFNPLREPIGTATLTKHEDGTITCVAEIAPGEEPFLPSFPKFAVAVACTGGTWKGARVYSVAVAHENKNPDIPPYAPVEDED